MKFNPFEDWHVWLNLENAELEVWHIGDCPYIPFYGTPTIGIDFEYLGVL